MKETVDALMAELQSLDWANPPIPVLVEIQGKLAGYLYNFGSYLQSAKMQQMTAEIAAKKVMLEAYTSYRNQGESQGDAEKYAKLDAIEASLIEAEAEAKYNELKHFIDSVNTAIIACQVAIKEGKRQVSTSSY